MQRLRKCIGTLAVFCVASAAAAAPVSAQTMTPAAVLDQFLSAVTRNDATAAANMFTSDAVFFGGPCSDSPHMTCQGQGTIREALADNPASVKLQGPPEMNNNTATFSVEERFEFPPALMQAGVNRYVERGSLMLQDGKIAAVSLAPDFSDSQTLTAFHAFSSMGQSAPPLPPTADDGQMLAQQPASTQLTFLYQWGDQAAAEWAKEHNAQLQSGSAQPH